ncbi:cofactor of APC complex [Seminavis robusta]|uniref:Cofactor of APC complex n=1 Tax=Seminavis robusta TaxID=568900 RepID=A0A9N8E3M5_9STRA|nr:cofactor of APC complex [Seminavis robusta]|eukprot:Sro625_g177590.1 cofactor of APC complex (470) ;mRNA; r:30654-32063
MGTAFEKPLSLQYINDEVPRTPESAITRRISTPGAPVKPRRSETAVYFARGSGDWSKVEFMSRNGHWTHAPTWGDNHSLGEEVMRFTNPSQQQQTRTVPIQAIRHGGHRRPGIPKLGLPPRPTRSSAPRQVTNPSTKAATTSIQQTFSIETPDVLGDDDLKLVSLGPSLAVALYDQLFLWSQNGQGSAELFTCTDDGAPISCVEWQDRTMVPTNQHVPLIAVGLKGVVEVWTVEEDGHVIQAFQDCHEGFITAISFKNDKILAASKSGIQRHVLDRGAKESTVYQYQDGHGGERITSLCWSDKGDMFVSAGNGVIQVWDAVQTGEAIQPLWTWHHLGVRCVAFSPGHHHNILVSGGEGGLKFWNLRNGELRSFLAVDGIHNPVTGIVWSRPTEVLISHGSSLSLWNPDRETKLVQVDTDQGKILSMDDGPNGSIVCIHEDEVVVGYSITGGSKMAHQSRGSVRRAGLFS